MSDVHAEELRDLIRQFVLAAKEVVRTSGNWKLEEQHAWAVDTLSYCIDVAAGMGLR